MPRPCWEGGLGRRVPQGDCAASPPAWRTTRSAPVSGPPRPLCMRSPPDLVRIWSDKNRFGPQCEPRILVGSRRGSERRVTFSGSGGNRTRAGRCETPSRIAPVPRNRPECLGIDIPPCPLLACWHTPEQDPLGPDWIGGPGHASPSLHHTSALCLSLRYVSAKPKGASGSGPETRQPPASGDAALDGRGTVRRPRGFRALARAGGAMLSCPRP